MKNFLLKWFSVWVIRVVWDRKVIWHFAWTQQDAIDWLMAYLAVDAEGVALNCATGRKFELGGRLFKFN